jgi:hypothetical protein
MSVCFRRTDAGWHEHVRVPVPDVLQGRTLKQEVLQIFNRPCMHTPLCIWPSAYCAHALGPVHPTIPATLHLQVMPSQPVPAQGLHLCK